MAELDPFIKLVAQVWFAVSVCFYVLVEWKYISKLTALNISEHVVDAMVKNVTPFWLLELAGFRWITYEYRVEGKLYTATSMLNPYRGQMQTQEGRMIAVRYVPTSPHISMPELQCTQLTRWIFIVRALFAFMTIWVPGSMAVAGIMFAGQ